MSDPILSVSRLKKYYPVKGSPMSRIYETGNRFVRAVDDVTFDVEQGDQVAIVGESGCGKTTTAKVILHLIEPTSGDVKFEGKSIFSLSHRQTRKLRTELQVVYQDPYEALNPKQRISDILMEPLIANRVGNEAYRQARVREVLREVGLTPEDVYLRRFPHELSGGQRQRVAIASALTVKPKLIIADEPVSMLDISKRLEIIQLLHGLKSAHNLTLLIITHDLPIARYLTNKMIVMYLGTIVESGPTMDILQHPIHPYTQALVSVTKVADRHGGSSKMVLKGETPNPVNIPAGCRFHTRCPYAEEICRVSEPVLTPVASRQQVACHFSEKFAEATPVDTPNLTE